MQREDRGLQFLLTSIQSYSTLQIRVGNINDQKEGGKSLKLATKSILTFIAMVIIIAILSCASAKFIATGPLYAARADDCPIEVFSSKLPDREYQELGIIEGEGSLGHDTLEKILPKMKREACKAGGDAIILTSRQKSADFFDDSGDEQLNVTATVIRWTE